MRILHFNDFAELVGGTEVYLLSLLEAQRAAGYEVHLSHGPEQLSSAGSIHRLVEDIQPDIVHIHNTSWPASFLGLAQKVPILRTIHCFTDVCPAGDYLFRGDKHCQRPLSAFCLASPYLRGCHSRRPFWVWKT